MAKRWQVENLPCWKCHQHEYELLSVRPNCESFVTTVIVPEVCSICEGAGAGNAWWVPCGKTQEVKKSLVYLPSDLVADANVLIQKFAAQSYWEQKSSNLDLQLVNLLSPTKAASFRYAYTTVGLAAIRCRHVKAARARDPINTACCGWVASYGGAQHNWRFTGILPDTPNRGDEPEEPKGKPDGKGGKSSKDDKGDSVQIAEKKVRIEEQQAAFLTGEKLESSTVSVSQQSSPCKNSGSVNDSSVGQRQATARFPQISETEQYLFNNNPTNLAAAYSMRGPPVVNVGNHDPAPRHAKRAGAVVKWLIDEVFTGKAIRKAMWDMTAHSGFPTKYSPSTKEAAMNSAMTDATSEDGVSWSKFVKAFVKAEVTNKCKPRPIANHGPERLAALAQVAYVYEHILFDTFEKASIKHRRMNDALGELMNNMSDVRDGNVWFENDLSSFEFGISWQLKDYECNIMYHIANEMGMLDVGQIAFERIISSRTKSCVWVMNYVDETGQRSSIRIKLPIVMRESGDRLTSSGNWLQNFIAWTTFLSDDETLIESLRKFAKSHGKNFFYTSERDGKCYLCRFAFEGDDTAGRISEFADKPELFCRLANEFFATWGWAPKLKAFTGTGALTFVGRQVFIKDGKACYEGDRLVTTPEISRFCKSKSWSTSVFGSTDEEKLCFRLYAASMAKDFAHHEPMYRLCAAIYEANEGGSANLGRLSVQATDNLRDVTFRNFGHFDTSEAILNGDVVDALPPFVGGGEIWREYSEHAAGEFTNLEWATMCGLRSAAMHGKDLATFVPASWVQ